MMTAKKHYDSHLGNFYSWMIGDLAPLQDDQEIFFRQQGIMPLSTGKALDLGAGNGINAIPLARIGFSVSAIDFNAQLLAELTANSAGHNIVVVAGDIRDVAAFAHTEAELVLCCGDTLTHLENETQLTEFLAGIADLLVPAGKLILSFRDYSSPLKGTQRFIPVKSDEKRILTCLLEYAPAHVTVTDALYEREGSQWELKLSSYKKLRIAPWVVAQLLKQAGMDLTFNEVVKGLVTIVAQKAAKKKV